MKLIISVICSLLSTIGYAEIPSDLHSAPQEIEKINLMRESLAATITNNEKITAKTFKRVCKPAGMAAKKLSQASKWTLRQASHKYRNPANKATPAEMKAISIFKKHPDLTAFYSKGSQKGKDGSFYFRRINVQNSCLNCHGQKEKRPNFIKAKHPKDLAFDFKVGDLRGVYSLFLAH